MLGHVSTSVTSQFVLELMTQVTIKMAMMMRMILMILMMLTKVSGHGGLVRCGQAELDTSVREYERCVRQVQHGLRSAHYMQIFFLDNFISRCLGSRDSESVCGWVAAFTSTCTGEVLARSLGHLVTWSLGHLVTWSLGHSVTCSLYVILSFCFNNATKHN